MLKSNLFIKKYLNLSIVSNNDNDDDSMPGTRIYITEELLKASKANNKLITDINSPYNQKKDNKQINLLDNLENIFTGTGTNNFNSQNISIAGNGINLIGENFNFESNTNNQMNDLFSSINSVNNKNIIIMLV